MRDLRPLALPVAVGILAAIVLWPSDSEASAPPSPPRGPIVPGGSILSRYGLRRTASGDRMTHYGIDLSARRGTPVLSPLRGTVAAVYADGEVSGYGNLVVVRYGDLGLLYAHLDTIGVSVGQTVDAGQPIGTVGSTDSTEDGFSSSGSHLHLEVMVPAAGRVERELVHFTQTTPPRSDPEAWAAASGLRLV